MQPTTDPRGSDTRGDHLRVADHRAAQGLRCLGLRCVVLLACAAACLLGRVSVTTSVVGVVLVTLVLRDLERLG